MTRTDSLPHGSHGHLGKPSLRTVALALDGVFAGMLAGLMIAASVFGQKGGETLGDNPTLAVFGIGAGVAALLGGIIALVALLRGEREGTIAIPLAIGGLVLFFLVGEFAFPH